MPRPRSLTLNTISVAASHRRQRDGLARLRIVDRVGEKIEQDLAHPPAVGVQRSDPVGHDDAQFDRRLAQAILHARRRGLHRLGDVDVLEPELQRAGVHRGQIENVVDDGEQRMRRIGDESGIFDLLRIERANASAREKLGEADNVGERRAQLVGDVVDEIVAQLFRCDQRLIALGQRALDVDARGHIERRHERRSVRQRQGGAIEDEPVRALDPRRPALAMVGKIDDHRLKLVEQLGVAAQRLAGARDLVDVRAFAQDRRIEFATVPQRPG